MDQRFRAALQRWGGEHGGLIPLLQQTQEIYGYLSREAMEAIAQATTRSPAEVYGVATFYAQFRFEPRGRHVAKVCHGTACHVAGAGLLDLAVHTEYAVGPGQTTADGELSVESVACLGCCSLAPVVMVDGEVHGRLTGDRLVSVLRKLDTP